MGLNTLTARVDSEIIPAADHNELVEALGIDFVPRNASRVPTDIIGQLGTSALRWLRVFSKEYFIGDAANNLKITESAAGVIKIGNAANDFVLISNGKCEFYTNNIVRWRVNDSGVDWTVIPNSSIPKEKVNGFIYNSYQTVNYGDVDESFGNTIISNIPRDAIIHTEFYGDGNGSRAYTYIEDSFSSQDYELIFGVHRYDATVWDHHINTNFAKAGSDIKESSQDFGTGKTSLRLHLFYI